MSIEQITKRLRSQQREVLEAIEARKGAKGVAYATLVKEAAGACACISVAQRTLPEFEAPFGHAASCVVAVGMNKVLDLFNVPAGTIDAALIDEFTSDITTITRFMLYKCKQDELDS